MWLRSLETNVEIYTPAELGPMRVQLDGAERATLPLAKGRRAYAHVARGAVNVNGQSLEAGDALKITDETEVRLEQGRGAEVLLFDLA